MVSAKVCFAQERLLSKRNLPLRQTMVIKIKLSILERLKKFDFTAIRIANIQVEAV